MSPSPDAFTPEDALAVFGIDDPDVRDAVVSNQRESSWVPADLGPAMRGEIPEIRPTLLTRSDGEALLYRGKTHSIAGEPESGKSWIALIACAEAMRCGQTVAYIDFEDSAAGAVERLRALKVDDEAISTRFLFVSPEESVRPRELDWVLEVGPALVVVDGVNASITLQGFDPQDTAGVEHWRRRVLGPLRAPGTAVLLLDHVVKSKESRSRYAFGSQHKLGSLDGAAYMLEPLRPFSRARAGASRLRVTKDRPGWVRAVAEGDLVADFRLEPSGDGTVNASLNNPAVPIRGGGLTPSAERVLAVLPTEQTEAIPQREIGDRLAQDGDAVFGPLRPKTIDEALRLLADKGRADRTAMGRGVAALWWRT